MYPLAVTLLEKFGSIPEMRDYWYTKQQINDKIAHVKMRKFEISCRRFSITPSNAGRCLRLPVVPPTELLMNDWQTQCTKTERGLKSTDMPMI
jgi:hypothetical protein